MKSKKPLVSVILPVYNGQRFLKQALSSVTSQTYLPMEILVINDGSTDESVKVAESFEGVNIISQKNQGNAAALNRGIKECQGDFISFLDADDCWAVNKTRLQMEFLSHQKDFDCVAGWFQNFFQPGIKIPPEVNKEILLNPDLGKMLSLGTLLAPRDLFVKVDLFNHTLKIGFDLDWFVRARDLGIKIGKIPRIVMYRRLHDSNISYQVDPGQLVNIFRSSIRRKESQKEDSQ